MSDVSGITPSRMAHMLGVARLAVDLGIERGLRSESMRQTLFLMGFLHDIGYEFCANQVDHEEVGGRLLKENGYRFWREVYHHGDPSSDYESELLDILNAADMQTDASGERVSFDDRLLDIAERYGESSSQYQNAANLAQRLRSKGF